MEFVGEKAEKGFFFHRKMFPIKNMIHIHTHTHTHKIDPEQLQLLCQTLGSATLVDVFLEFSTVVLQQLHFSKTWADGSR